MSRSFAACFCVFCVFTPPARPQAPTSPAYTITTFAGNGNTGSTGDGGAAISAQLSAPFAVAVDAAGNAYIADEFNNKIRKVSPDGTISTVAGTGTSGYAGDGGPAASAQFSSPSGIVVDASGNLYIADSGNNVIRMVTANGNISTVAGMQNATVPYGGDGGPATSAQLYNPSGLALDSVGDLYIADTYNNVVRMVAPDGTITTLAGNNAAATGFSGDGGAATSAVLNNPVGLAVDAARNLYIADGGNNRIRLVSADTGNISTVAGSGTGGGYSGDGGAANKAKLNTPKGIALDPAGNLYIADRFNSAIRMVTVTGTISTIAGSANGGYSGDGGPATGATLFEPTWVAVANTGKIYIADNGNDVIRLLTPAALPPSIASKGVVGAAAFGAFTSVAPGSWIEIYGSNLASDSRMWTGTDFKGANAPTSLDGTSVSIGGVPAFVDYISAGQVNAQVPSNVGTGSQPLKVTTASGSSAPYAINVTLVQPGLFTAAKFSIGGLQYAAALFTDNATYVLPPGAIPGVTSRQAKPGETVIFYGAGFGPVTPNIPAGQIVQQNNSLAANFQISFGSAPAALSYSGLAPGAIGLYQFNAIVPNIANSDSVPLTFTLNGAPGTQTLYTAVHN